MKDSLLYLGATEEIRTTVNRIDNHHHWLDTNPSIPWEMADKVTNLGKVVVRFTVISSYETSHVGNICRRQDYHPRHFGIIMT